MKFLKLWKTYLVQGYRTWNECAFYYTHEFAQTTNLWSNDFYKLRMMVIPHLELNKIACKKKLRIIASPQSSSAIAGIFIVYEVCKHPRRGFNVKWKLSV